MSEPKKWKDMLFMFVLVGYAVAFCYIAVDQRLKGRDEMRHWQDEYYAAHYVTKIEYREGPAREVYVAKDGEQYDAVARGWAVNGNMTCFVVPGNARILMENMNFYNDAKNPACQLIADGPPPPKPTKGSKRHSNLSYSIGGPTEGAITCTTGIPAKCWPANEQEPAPKPSIEEGRLWFEAPSHELHYYKNGIDMTCSSWNESRPAAPQPAEPNQQ